MATATEHRGISDRFLDHAEREYSRGGMLQASEKTWGALAHYVKAVAKSRGWATGTHRQVNVNAMRLIELTATPAENTNILGALNGLHSNFYEAQYTEAQVRQGIASARNLIAAMREAEKRLGGGASQ